MNIATEPFVAVPISQRLFVELAVRYPDGVAEVLDYVLTDFLDRTSEDFEISNANPYLWDRLSVPSGTKVRTKYYGEYLYAEVDDGNLHWDGEELNSMSQLASAIRGGTSNNAWKVIELQFPNQQHWTLADRCRK
jgi:hypothetical protein